MPEFTLRYVTGIATLLTVFSVLWALSQGALRRKAERELVAVAVKLDATKQEAGLARAARDLNAEAAKELSRKLYDAQQSVRETLEVGDGTPR